MYFVVLCNDKPDHLQVRLDNRSDHLAFLGEHNSTVKLAGPLLSGEGNPIGSMLIIDCADETSARHFLDKDPYARAGLFASVELKPWRWALGTAL
jgi:uncharacterized protein YciI